MLEQNIEKHRKTCCDCFTARTGAYIIAILGMSFGIINLVITEIHCLRTKDMDSDVKYVFYGSFAGSIFYSLIQVLLLAGLIKNSSCLLTFWMVNQALFGLVSKSTVASRNSGISR